MTCDQARNLVVLFGGLDAAELGDTWEWDGGWVQLEDNGPGARRGHSMAYDLPSTQVVLFGGASGAQVLDDTWGWNGTQWKQLAGFGAPASWQTAMTYAGRGSTLFGGIGTTAAGEAGRDSTWEWDGRFWTEFQHFGPPGRSAHAMTFDTARSRVVVYGGLRVSGPPAADSLLGDTWECPAREPVVISVTVSPTEVRQGDTVLLTLRLSGTSADDLPVQLTSSMEGQTASLALPLTVTVPKGHDATTLTATVPMAAPTGVYAVTATTTGASRSTLLVVDPAQLLRIVGMMPNPGGNEAQNEEVHIRNVGVGSVPLDGWQLTNPQGQAWPLNAADGTVAPGQVVIVLRLGRPMVLLNTGGTVILNNPAGVIVDSKVYPQSNQGAVITFE